MQTNCLEENKSDVNGYEFGNLGIQTPGIGALGTNNLNQ